MSPIILLRIGYNAIHKINIAEKTLFAVLNKNIYICFIVNVFC